MVSTPFLNELGLLQRLPIWRATFANQRSRAKAVESEPLVQITNAHEEAVASQSANSLPAPVAETQTATTAPAPRSELRQWIYTGVAAVVVAALALLLQLEMTSDDSVHVHAREVDSTVASAPTPQPLAVAKPIAGPAAPVASASVAPTSATVEPAGVSVPVTASAPPAIEAPLIVATASKAPVVSEKIATHSAATNASPAVASLPFRLNGIIYGVSNPSATVNGKAVYVGEKVNGATVLSIGRSEVVLEINGERKTVSLPAVH